MMARKLGFALVLLALVFGLSPGAFAQQIVRVASCGAQSLSPSPPTNSLIYMDLTGNICSGGVTAAPVTTYQGTLTVSNSSIAISTLTLSNSTTFPTAAMGVVFVLNTGSNTVWICFFGGSCSAGSGSFPLVAGASVTKNLGAATTVPTVFSTSGTTLAITN